MLYRVITAVAMVYLEACYGFGSEMMKMSAKGAVLPLLFGVILIGAVTKERTWFLCM